MSEFPKYRSLPELKAAYLKGDIPADAQVKVEDDDIYLYHENELLYEASSAAFVSEVLTLMNIPWTYNI